MWVFSGYFSNFILSSGNTVKWISLKKVTRDLCNKNVNIFYDYSSNSNFRVAVLAWFNCKMLVNDASYFSEPINRILIH